MIVLSESSGIGVQAFRRKEGSLPRQLEFWVASWVWRTKFRSLYKEPSPLRRKLIHLRPPSTDSDLTVFLETIAGPAGSPYEGGFFHLRISLS